MAKNIFNKRFVNKLLFIILLFSLFALMNSISFATDIKTGYTNTKNVKIREKKNSTSKVVTSISKKLSKITLYDYDLSKYWTKVSYNNGENIFNGYIKTSKITLKKSFLETAIECHRFLNEQNFKYNWDYTKNVLKLTRNNKKHVDCSSYVSLALYEYGITDFSGNQKISGDFYDIGYMLKNNTNISGKVSRTTGNNSKYCKYFTLIKKANVKAGDILVYDGHVEIFAEKTNESYYVYNCGDNSSINTKEVANEKSKSRKKFKSIKYILRVKELYTTKSNNIEINTPLYHKNQL